MKNNITAPAVNENRFPIIFHRTCEECGTNWHQTTERKSLACPDCGTAGRWSSQLVEITRLDGRLKIDHYEYLSPILSRYTDEISPWNAVGFYDVPLWLPLQAQLIRASAAPETIIVSQEGRLLFEPAIDTPFQSIEVWYDSSTARARDNESLIACHVRVDGEDFVSWSQPVATGAGMTHIVAEYCGCISASKLASEMAIVLQGLNGDAVAPSVTIYGDTTAVPMHVHGHWSVNEPHLRPLCQQVRRFLKRVDGRHEYLDGRLNLAEALFPTAGEVRGD